MEKTLDNSPCETCGGTNYYLEMGFYVCTECLTLSQQLREEVFEYNFATDLAIKSKILIKNTEKKRKTTYLRNDSQLTSFEVFNYILKGFVDDLIENGASPKLKITALQLWVLYLKSSEVAFCSKEEMLPKLSYKYYTKDAQLLYNTPLQIASKHRIGKKISSLSKLKPKRKTRSSKSSPRNDGNCSDSSPSTSKKTNTKRNKTPIYEDLYKSDASINQSQASVFSELEINLSKSILNEDDMSDTNASLPSLSSHTKKVFTSLKNSWKGKSVQTLIKLKNIIPLIYIALTICNEDIQISDLMRWSRENHTNFPKYIPEEEVDKVMRLLQPNKNPALCYKTFMIRAGYLAHFLGVGRHILPSNPNLMKIIKRHIINLSLPDCLCKYIERLLSFCPKLGHIITNYSHEIRAITLIIMTLKIIFGLDGETEHQLSKVAKKVNRHCTESNEVRLFNWDAWVEFYETRKAAIIKYHLPSLLNYYPDQHYDVQSYMNLIHKNAEGNDKAIPQRNVKCENIHAILKEHIKKFEEKKSESSFINFSPTLYPWRDYLNYLLESSQHSKELPLNILKQDFSKSSLDFIFKPKQFTLFAETLGFKVQYIKGSLQKNTEMIPRPKLTQYDDYKKNNVKISYSQKSEKPKKEKKINKSTNEKFDESKKKNEDTIIEENDPNTLIIPLPYTDYWYIAPYKMTPGKNPKEYIYQIHPILPPSLRWLIEETAKLIEAQSDQIFTHLFYLESLYSQITNTFD